MTTTAHTAKMRAKLAEYAVLDRYDDQRAIRYGDMASSRRGRELGRLAREIRELSWHDTADAELRHFHGGADLPAITDDELRAAFERVARPRIARLKRESYRAGTRYTRATWDAWQTVARVIGADL